MIAPVPYPINTYGATKHGTRSPFTGLTACTPSGTPSFVSASSWLASDATRARSTRGRTCSQVPASSASRCTAGCSTANTKNVTPHRVSGRVVKIVISSPVSSIVNVTSAPSERPIQFRCIVTTRSGQSTNSSTSSSNRCA